MKIGMIAFFLTSYTDGLFFMLTGYRLLVSPIRIGSARVGHVGSAVPQVASASDVGLFSVSLDPQGMWSACVRRYSAPPR